MRDAPPRISARIEKFRRERRIVRRANYPSRQADSGSNRRDMLWRVLQGEVPGTWGIRLNSYRRHSGCRYACGQSKSTYRISSYQNMPTMSAKNCEDTSFLYVFNNLESHPSLVKGMNTPFLNQFVKVRKRLSTCQRPHHFWRGFVCLLHNGLDISVLMLV